MEKCKLLMNKIKKNTFHGKEWQVANEFQNHLRLLSSTSCLLEPKEEICWASIEWWLKDVTKFYVLSVSIYSYLNSFGIN